MGSGWVAGVHAASLVLAAQGFACESIAPPVEVRTTRSSLSGEVAPVLGSELALPATAMAALDDFARDPSVASDGSNYFVVWEERGDIEGIRMAASGARVEPEPFVVGQGRSLNGAPAVAFGGTRYLVVFPDTAALRGVFVTASDGTVGAPMVIGRRERRTHCVWEL
jgi:hypothetical protein